MLNRQIIVGDCLDVLPTMDADSIDACITDPPYHLTAMTKRFGNHDSAPAKGGAFQRHNAGFMGQQWDGGDIAFQPETWAAVYRVLKPGAMLLAFGGSRTFHRLAVAIEDAGFEIRDTLCWLYGQGMPKSRSLLKPAYEAIIMARKPGPLNELNIDACRIQVDPDEADALRGKPWTVRPSLARPEGCGFISSNKDGDVRYIDISQGRWPSNVILDEEAARLLDEQSGTSQSRIGKPRRSSVPGNGWGSTATGTEYDDAGGASRFFYVAKANKRERGEGNGHPTVKPLSLIEYLVKMVTPPGGTVLDPFLGSGTTAVACAALGFGCIGIERESTYAEIARRRLERYGELVEPQGVST